jgi:hypothetical protein
MADIIYIGDDTTQVHGVFIGWLNGLLNNYTSGFWDDAVDAMVTGAFITKTYGHMQEMYNEEGDTLLGYVTVTPTNSANTGLLVHDATTGVPYMYTYDNLHLLFTFDATGILTGFTANNTIPLLDADGITSSHEAYIGYENHWGIKIPFLYIIEKATNNKIMRGAVDVWYQDRLSPSYAVKNVPTDSMRVLKIRNVGRNEIRMDFPVFKGYFMELNLKRNRTALIPSTELSRHFAKDLKNAGNITYIEQDA